MHYLEATLKVLLVGLLLGAGLPAVFATGLLAYSSGLGGEDADAVVHRPNPLLKYVGILLFGLVGLVVVAAVAWIARATTIHHFGIDLFPMFPKK